MRLVALSLLVFSSSTFAGDQTANKAAAKPAADQQPAAAKADTAEPAAQPAAASAKPAAAAADTATAKPAASPAAPAPDNSMSSVAKSMTLEAAIAYELSFAKPFGLTIYKGANFLLPGLTELGLNSKLPDPVLPGQDETVPESMPPSENADIKGEAKGTEAK